MGLIGKVVEGIADGINVRGRVLLIYDDAIRSGTNEYVSVTYLLLTDKSGAVHKMYPRDVIKITEEY